MKIACIFEVRPVQSARFGHVRLGIQHKWPIRRNVSQSRASAFSPTHPPFASRCSRIDGQRTDKRAFRHDMTRSPSAFLFFYYGGAVAFPDKIKDSHTFSSTMRSRVAGEELWRLPAPHLHRDTRRPSPTFPLLAKCIVTASQRERNPAALFRLTFATARSQGIP